MNKSEFMAHRDRIQTVVEDVFKVLSFYRSTAIQGLHLDLDPSMLRSLFVERTEETTSITRDGDRVVATDHTVAVFSRSGIEIHVWARVSDQRPATDAECRMIDGCDSKYYWRSTPVTREF